MGTDQGNSREHLTYAMSVNTYNNKRKQEK
jgi:hypothetical protein